MAVSWCVARWCAVVAVADGRCESDVAAFCMGMSTEQWKLALGEPTRAFACAHTHIRTAPATHTILACSAHLCSVCVCAIVCVYVPVMCRSCCVDCHFNSYDLSCRWRIAWSARSTIVPSKCIARRRKWWSGSPSILRGPLRARE